MAPAKLPVALQFMIVVRARGNLDTVFDGLDGGVNALSVRDRADDLLDLLLDEVFTKPALTKLLDAVRAGQLSERNSGTLCFSRDTSAKHKTFGLFNLP